MAVEGALFQLFAPIRVSTADLCRFLGAGRLLRGGDTVSRWRCGPHGHAPTFTVVPGWTQVVLDRITGVGDAPMLMLVLLPLLWWRIGQGSAVFG